MRCLFQGLARAVFLLAGMAGLLVAPLPAFNVTQGGGTSPNAPQTYQAPQTYTEGIILTPSTLTPTSPVTGTFFYSQEVGRPFVHTGIEFKKMLLEGDAEAGGVGGSGTAGKIPVFTASNTLGNSIVSATASGLTVAGGLEAGTLFASQATVGTLNGPVTFSSSITATAAPVYLGAVRVSSELDAASGDAPLYARIISSNRASDHTLYIGYGDTTTGAHTEFYSVYPGPFLLEGMRHFGGGYLDVRLGVAIGVVPDSVASSRPLYVNGMSEFTDNVQADSLDITKTLRTVPTDVTPATPVEGMLFSHDSENRPKYYDGTSWKRVVLDGDVDVGKNLQGGRVTVGAGITSVDVTLTNPMPGTDYVASVEVEDAFIIHKVSAHATDTFTVDLEANPVGLSFRWQASAY